MIWEKMSIHLVQMSRHGDHKNVMIACACFYDFYVVF